MKPAITRYQNKELRAYKLPESVTEALGLAATYRVESKDKVQGHAATPNLDRTVYTTRNKVTCIGRDGGLLWSYDIEPRTSERLPRTACVFSLDGDLLLLYRPNAMTERGPDRLVALLASTGEVVAQAKLDTVGQAAQFVQHPDGRQFILEVGEGQDEVKLFLAALTDGGGIDLHSYGWNDRCLIDIAPDGQIFMTVDHDRWDVAFHAFPSGEEILRLSRHAFGYEDDENDEHDEDVEEGEEDEEEDSYVDWGGGFLNAHIAVVVITGERNDEEWHHYYQVDLRTGKSLGRFEAHSTTVDSFQTLGDGTWVAFDSNGNPVILENASAFQGHDSAISSGHDIGCVGIHWGGIGSQHRNPKLATNLLSKQETDFWAPDPVDVPSLIGQSIFGDTSGCKHWIWHR